MIMLDVTSISWDFYSTLGFHDNRNVLKNNHPSKPGGFICMGGLTNHFSWAGSDFEQFTNNLIVKIKLRSSKSCEHINEKGNGPYRGFGYLSFFSDPIDLATCTVICFFQQGSRYKDLDNPNGAKYIKRWLENKSQPIIFFQNTLAISNDQKENITCMNDVWDAFLEPPHGTTPVAVIANN